ncbi:MAG: isoleucine--tRNA ligase [Planctomycetota bacterium]|nr:isoleucine--tRNA ligase [Planctomycetota bacterium]
MLGLRPDGNMAPFPDLPSEDVLEQEVSQEWEKTDLPTRHLSHREGAEPFVFYEGPPTANGRPALHHVFSRTLKDTVCRHRVMKGQFVPRRAGWDTQGLPVEIEVQKELGISTREEIEEIGIEVFNEKCRASVFTYVEEWERLSRRMAYWLDYEKPYVTLEASYIESCWAILQRFHQAGLLEQDFKVLPYCPRCATGLSNHEVAQGYEEIQDPSVWVRFAVDEVSWRDKAPFGEVDVAPSAVSLLAWTTTPWTLFSNVAIAAHRDLTYVLVRVGEELLVIAQDRLEVLGEEVDVVAQCEGQALEGLAYVRPLTEVAAEDTGDTAFTVRLADYVSAEEGTGLVHTAPAFGIDDFSLRAKEGLPLLCPVDDQGCFTEAVEGFAGRFVKEADRDIIRLLKERGSLFRQETVDHSYPHCWRCTSPLIYMARPSWYLRTTTFAEAMLKQNDAIRWVPDEIGKGRFGEWLSHNVDWAISRERYWGTPLNLWICGECESQFAPASFSELFEKAGQPCPDDFDPHRPGVDDITVPCSSCEGTMVRTPEVVDCWFDSGAMPFAQAGWPESSGGELPSLFPADFICEGLDQTRGWFYTLHAIATFLTGEVSGEEKRQSAYRACLVHNLLLDQDGKKMSKSRGNVLDPWALFDQAGVDALRWFFLNSGQVWLPKRFDESAVSDGARRTFGTLRNCYAFLALYANLDGWEVGDEAPPKEDRPSIDRWLLSRIQTVAQGVDDALEALQLTEASRVLENFIDRELSNWYVRRNRARFWKSGDDSDKRAAFATLTESLEIVSRLLAPMAPFLSDCLWRSVTGAEEGESVHLSDWPIADPAGRDEELEEDMAVVLAAVELGRTVRSTHALKTRQPLSTCLIRASLEADAERLRRPDLARLVCEELNVRKLEVVDRADFRELSAKPDFKVLGPRFGSKMKALSFAVGALDEQRLEEIRETETFTLDVEGETVELSSNDLVFQDKGREGYAVASDGRLVLALDTQLDEGLIQEGHAREIVNRVQNTRKRAGLDVADRVVVHMGGAPALIAAARQHEDLILGEVLGVRLEYMDEGGQGAESFDIDGAALQVSVERTED